CLEQPPSDPDARVKGDCASAPHLVLHGEAHSFSDLSPRSLLQAAPSETKKGSLRFLDLQWALWCTKTGGLRNDDLVGRGRPVSVPVSRSRGASWLHTPRIRRSGCVRPRRPSGLRNQSRPRFRSMWPVCRTRARCVPTTRITSWWRVSAASWS